MTDYFALLGQERRPWLEAEELKARYHRLTAEQHPDIAGMEGGSFAEINRGYQVLSEPGRRLRHLLELEAGEAGSRTQAVPERAARFFATVGMARQEVEVFFKKRAGAANPLARALLAAEQYRVQEAVEGALAELEREREQTVEEVRRTDGLWVADRRAAVAMLPELWQALTYLDKWQAALREDLYRLAALQE